VLQASLKQSDARVRREVAAGLLGFYREAAYDAARKILADEKNPDIQITAIAALAPYPKPETKETLLRYLKSESYRNSLADAAVTAARGQDDATYVAPLLAVLKEREPNFTTPGFGRALSALAWLSRNEEKKDAAREFLLGHLNSPRQQVKIAAINALGTLGDTKAIAALEVIAAGPKGNTDRASAERAVTLLRDTRKPAAEVSTLRTEVTTLQKDNRELRREMDDLKKKLDALLPKPAATKATKKK